MRNILGIHMGTLLQSRIAKSLLVNVHEILLSRKQRAATNAVSSGSALLVLQPPNQIVHDCGGDFFPPPRVKVTQKKQKNEENCPIPPEETNTGRPPGVSLANFDDGRKGGRPRPHSF